MINLIVVVAIAVLAVLAFYFGARMQLTAIMAFYPAAMIYTALPWQENMLFLGTKGISLFYSHALLFVLIFAVAFYVLYSVNQRERLGYGANKIINSILIGVGVVLAAIALAYHILPAHDLFELSARAQNFWTSDMGYFVAILAPLVAIWKVCRT